MTVVAELTAIGVEPHQRWQKPIPDGEPICLGRAPRQGWRVPWDIMISREHAELLWKDRHLCVRCLDTARNPIVFQNQATKEFVVGAGESFRIGATRFVLSEPVEPVAGKDLVEERSFGPNDLKNVPFRDAPKQMELISRLPSLIGASRTDEEFAVRLVSLLLEAMPRSDIAAVVRYDEGVAPDKGQPAMMRWDSRNEQVDRFMPSRRLLARALVENRSLLHMWGKDDSSDAAYTVYGNLDWAICTPITNEACRGWCLYASGRSGYGTSGDDLKGDVKFTELMAQFIGSIRQVRQLEKMQAGMSQFFSPTVLETLNTERANILLKPKESDITVIFCDVRGFSKMAEKSSENLLYLLERVSQALGVMSRGIVRQDGIIADFQGDAALGFWGWPVTLIDGPLPACLAALEIHSEFSQAAARADDPLSGFRIGIGIAHGRAVAGKIGSDQQAKVGVFGPVVNLGSRLEGMTKQIGVPILIDESTALHLRDALPRNLGRCRRLGRIRPYGIDAALMVSELLPPESQCPEVSDQQIAQFESAVDAVVQGDWGQARSLLQTLPEEDGARAFLADFLARHHDSPPATWDGVITLAMK
ncbi:MAG: adenylate/guanylate cyclase domain-containing protein [Planctomycetales bacterium]